MTTQPKTILTLSITISNHTSFIAICSVFASSSSKPITKDPTYQKKLTSMDKTIF